MTDVDTAAVPGTRPLFVATVRHDLASGIEHPAHAEGEPVGKGSGHAYGPVLAGSVRWALSERIGENVCAMNLFAVIETVDDVLVDVEGQGFARRDDPSSDRWEIAGALRVTSPDPRYAWLGDQLAAWDGEFHSSTGAATWRAYLRT